MYKYQWFIDRLESAIAWFNNPVYLLLILCVYYFSYYYLIILLLLNALFYTSFIYHYVTIRVICAILSDISARIGLSEKSDITIRLCQRLHSLVCKDIGNTQCLDFYRRKKILIYLNYAIFFYIHTCMHEK